MKQFLPLTPQGYIEAASESAKYRHLTAKYCTLADGTPGVGVDIASQGDAVVPWAISFDLPKVEFELYCGGAAPKGPIALRGHADKLPFENESLDFCYSSHLLEDYADWYPVLKEWVRVLKRGGYLVILVPDKALWAAAMKRGQPGNAAHKHEATVGELSEYAPALGLEVMEDRLTEQFPNDYTILFAGRRI